jgi:hypothetical protein
MAISGYFTTSDIHNYYLPSVLHESTKDAYLPIARLLAIHGINPCNKHQNVGRKTCNEIFAIVDKLVQSYLDIVSLEAQKAVKNC